MPTNLSPYLTKPEKDCVAELVAAFDWDGERAHRVGEKAAETITAMRAAKRKAGSIESFFQTYSLNTQEGIALMTLAEALLRIPDAATANALIRDKIARTEWLNKDGAADDWLLRMAGLGLSATRSTLDSPFSKLGEPVIRKALSEAMKVLGGQFVLGQTIGEALKHAAALDAEKGYLFSYDMLGEGARTDEDAETYYKSYEDAIEEIGRSKLRKEGRHPGISVKLSALHPRYSFAQEANCVPALTRKLTDLCRKAAALNICLTVDAEEVDRLETSLKIIRPVIEDITLTGWEGFGLAVQAYGKRTAALIDNLIELAEQTGKRFQIRLVKGAYWDTEIKRAQVKGLADYPVFTRKAHTDLSYLVCAQKLLQARRYIYPMFGTHNAHTVRSIIDMAGADSTGFEFQRLFGMGDALYDQIRTQENLPVRIYAPVGVHRDLLPYLVRRLLENGANSSFVNKALDERLPPIDLVRDPLEAVLDSRGLPHSSIRLPSRIFPDRLNSVGMDVDDAATLQAVQKAMDHALDHREVICGSLIDGRMERTGNTAEIVNPADRMERIGTAYAATDELLNRAFHSACRAFPDWNGKAATERAGILNNVADLYEKNMPLLLALCIHEAGKTLPDAIAEVREAIDFCRYYAAQAGRLFDENGENLRSYTGESNKILLQGRGVFVCISPWNFPLAIFTGQVVAALAAGNTVLAKPAEQTPFIAQAAVRFMHQAGIPPQALQLLIGDGHVGEAMVQHKLVSGVAFTGSTGAAWSINRALAAKHGPIVPLIAETGGQNAIIADSSSLTEQVIDDVIVSAFGSAGQRCSAARILFVQDEVADKTIRMLQGAMAKLRVGNPRFYATDVGPVIDEEALAALQRHKTYMDGVARKIAEVDVADELRRMGHFFAPVAYEIDDINLLKGEVFGPFLHVMRYRGAEPPSVLKALNDTGYGLTFGFHTRIDAVWQDAVRHIAAGNIYINRSIIGAVVGVQPFGGNGLSGTGPKAGGPHYLHRFACEKTISVNTTAAGGNASLVMLEE